MASTKEYADFILEQLSELDEIASRRMMGEYIIYFRGKIIGGIYDNRFLVKPTKSAPRESASIRSSARVRPQILISGLCLRWLSRP